MSLTLTTYPKGRPFIMRSRQLGAEANFWIARGSRIHCGRTILASFGTDLIIVTVSGDVETNATISGRIVGLKIIG